METNSENKVIQMWSGKDPFSAPQHFKEVVRKQVKKCSKENFLYKSKALERR